MADMDYGIVARTINDATQNWLRSQALTQEASKAEREATLAGAKLDIEKVQAETGLRRAAMEEKLGVGKMEMEKILGMRKLDIDQQIADSTDAYHKAVIKHQEGMLENERRKVDLEEKLLPSKIQMQKAQAAGSYAGAALHSELAKKERMNNKPVKVGPFMNQYIGYGAAELLGFDPNMEMRTEDAMKYVHDVIKDPSKALALKIGSMQAEAGAADREMLKLLSKYDKNPNAAVNKMTYGSPDDVAYRKLHTIRESKNELAAYVKQLYDSATSHVDPNKIIPNLIKEGYTHEQAAAAAGQIQTTLLAGLGQKQYILQQAQFEKDKAAWEKKTGQKWTPPETPEQRVKGYDSDIDQYLGVISPGS